MFYNEHMFSFLKNKPKEEQTICVLVVNSYSVTAAVVRTYHREDAIAKPVVLFSSEEKIPHHHTNRVGYFEHLVIAETKKVLERCRTVHGNYDKVVCVIGEPWIVTKTRDIKIEKQAPFKITKKVVDEAILRDARLFEQEILRDYAKEEAWGILHNSKPIIDINGYPVSSPIGMSAKSFDVHVVMSLAPSSFVEMIIGAYADVFHRADIAFMGMDVVASQLVRQYDKGSVLTLGGVSGTIAGFHHGILEYTEMVEEGFVAFEDALTYIFDVNHAHIPSVMKFASDEKILAHERDIYYQRIESAYSSLSNELRLAVLRAKKQIGNIVEPLFVIASPAWLHMIRPLLERDVEASITIPNPDMFDNYLIYTHDAKVKSVALSLVILAGLENNF